MLLVSYGVDRGGGVKRGKYLSTVPVFFFVYVLPDECSGIYSFLLAGGVGLHRSSTWSPFSNGNILPGSKDDVVEGLMLNCWLIIGAMSDD